MSKTIFSCLMAISIVLSGWAVVADLVVIFFVHPVPETQTILGSEKFMATNFLGLMGFILLLCLIAIKAFDLEVKITKK